MLGTGLGEEAFLVTEHGVGRGEDDGNLGRGGVFLQQPGDENTVDLLPFPHRGGEADVHDDARQSFVFRQLEDLGNVLGNEHFVPTLARQHDLHELDVDRVVFNDEYFLGHPSLFPLRSF